VNLNNKTGFSFKAGGFYDGSFPIIKEGAIEKVFDWNSGLKTAFPHNGDADTLGYALLMSGNISEKIYETCHGVGYHEDDIGTKAGRTGEYNFYNAPYGPGYYQPPFGEFHSIAEGEDTIKSSSTRKLGELNKPDQLNLFGLRLREVQNTKGYQGFDECMASIESAPMVRFHEVPSYCPRKANQKKVEKYVLAYPHLSVGSLATYELTNGGFSHGLFGGNIYNHNPFPCSYDRGMIIVNSVYKMVNRPSMPFTAAKCRYDITGPVGVTKLNPYDRAGDYPTLNEGLKGGKSNPDGFPNSPTPVSFTQESKERHVEGLADFDMNSVKKFILFGKGADRFFSFNAGMYWDFVFKGNHRILPFGNETEINGKQAIKQNDLERENHWWEHREYPQNIDFLNHAYGNNLNACPSNYLDVPYYASIGRFGYLGARFQNTLTKGKTGADHPDGLFAHVGYEKSSSPVKDSMSNNYDTLLKTAATEAQNYSWFVSDRSLFLNLNKNILSGSQEYKDFKNSTSITQEVKDSFDVLCDIGATGLNFTTAEQSGTKNDFFISGINRGPESFVYDESPIEKLALNLSGADLLSFDNLIKKYASFKVKDVIGNIDTEWYDNVTNQKRRRIASGYYSNIVLGNPVDLFPDNQITFCLEKANDFINSKYIKFATINPSSNQGPTEEVPVTDRRYFSTSFSKQTELDRVSGIVSEAKNKIKSISPHKYNNDLTGSTNNFYLGNMNRKKCGIDNFIPEREVSGGRSLGSANLSLTVINPPHKYQGAIFNSSHWSKFAAVPWTTDEDQDGNPIAIPPVEDYRINPLRSGWHTVGLGDIGKIKGHSNFSCFLPLFLQQPRNEFVKLRQPPKFRVYALDYHSIPEEKIRENLGTAPRARGTISNVGNGFGDDGGRIPGHPEINYWLLKTKTTNQRGKNLYPLKYKWYRITRTNAPNYYKTKNQNLLEASSIIGDWCCAEGDGPDCTVIKPKECRNLNGGLMTSAGTISEESASIFMGPNADDANNYYYFCRVEGRFGWRDSEFAKITQDDTVTASIAIYSKVGTMSSPQMIVGDPKDKIQFKFPARCGIIPDPDILSEAVQETIFLPGNKIRSECTMTRIVGPEGVRGVTRVFTPSTNVDTIGKTIRGAHFQELGAIVDNTIKITDDQAKILYCRRALPYCNVDANGNAITQTWPGVPISFPGFIHRTRYVKAIFSNRNAEGRRINQIQNIAQFYPQITYRGTDLLYGQNYNDNQGHDQFQENLGAIKILSRKRENNFNNQAIEIVPSQARAFSSRSEPGFQQAITELNLPQGTPPLEVWSTILQEKFFRPREIAGNKVKQFLNKHFGFSLQGNLQVNPAITNDVITGPECGYVDPTAGRLMHYYVEAKGNYNIACFDDGSTIRNTAFIAPGLRTGRPGLQYNFLGKPNSTRLRWKSMPGPYAFQWKVERHNRDRNGNGMPLGFYSYIYGTRIDDLYDAAAVYGASMRIRPPDPGLRNDIKNLKKLRQIAFNAGMDGYSDQTTQVLVTTHGVYGPPGRGCGTLQWKIFDDGGCFPNCEIVDYIEAASNFGSPERRDFPRDYKDFGCLPQPTKDFKKLFGGCFPPCLSLKYPEGFNPKGGRSFNMKLNGGRNENIFLCHPSSSNQLQPQQKFAYRNSKLANIIRINMTPCEDGKDFNKDLCNYLTPTLHLGTDTWPSGPQPNSNLNIAKKFFLF